MQLLVVPLSTVVLAAVLTGCNGVRGADVIAAMREDAMLQAPPGATVTATEEEPCPDSVGAYINREYQGSMPSKRGVSYYTERLRANGWGHVEVSRFGRAMSADKGELRLVVNFVHPDRWGVSIQHDNTNVSCD